MFPHVTAGVPLPAIGSEPKSRDTAASLAAASETYFRERRIESPEDLAQSFALRYQVYCEEMGFLDPNAYPERRESDAYDDGAWHFGSFNNDGAIVGTVRLVEDRGLGLPMDRHCALFPEERKKLEALSGVMEISRLVVSPRYRRRKGDGSWGLPDLSGVPESAPLPPGSERRQPVFPTVVRLYRVMYHAMKQSGRIHLLASMETSLYRALRALRFPFRQIGPLADYYGPVTPFYLNVEEMELSLHAHYLETLEYFNHGLESEFKCHLIAEQSVSI